MDILDFFRSKDFVEYLSVTGVDLEPHSDGTYRGVCPLHEGASNPTSFTVYTDTQTAICWSCGFHGDIVTFTMMKNNCTFDEAVNILAENYNINLNNDEIYVKQKSISEKNEYLCKQYQRNTGTIYDYLIKRGFTDEIIELYGFGYDNKGKRMAIPLVNRYGRIVGFTYRYFEGDKKYKHTPNNELFDKSKYWFNLINARPLIKKKNRVWLVEGHIDAASAQQQGEPALAYLGITMSKDQLFSLKQIMQPFGGAEIILVPDNDGRAVEHIPKARQMFKKYWPNANIRVAVMPCGGEIKDFNDILKAGMSISDLKTVHIDLFTCELLMNKCPNREQEYVEAQNFVRTVDNELIKADIARMLAKRWQRESEIEEIKKYLNVKLDDKEEKLKNMHDVLSCLDDWEELCESESKGIGWPEIDYSLNGTRNKEIILLGGYSNSGKSTVMAKIVAKRIAKYKDNVLVFSQEMPRGQFIELLACELLGMNQYKLNELRKTERGIEIYQKLMNSLGEYLQVIDISGLTMKDVWEYTEIANTYKFKKPVSFVAFDHFHLMPGVEDTAVCAENANMMKEYVKHFKLTLLMLVQFNEESQRSKTGKFIEPSMTSIKGSNALKAIADTIMLVWREYYRTDLSQIEREEKKYISIIKLAKHRRGLRGEMYFQLRYDPDTTHMSII